MTAVIDSYTYELLATPQFARIVDSTGSDAAYGCTTDSDGNVYIIGQYSGTPVISDQFGGFLGTLPANTNTVGFVSKFDSSGNYQYSRVIVPTSSAGGNFGACDSLGNLYISGFYAGTAVIKTQSGTDLATLPSLSQSAFFSKFDSIGNYQYSLLADSTTSSTDSSYGITTDSSNNVYFIFYSNGTTTLSFRNSSNVSTNIATLPASSAGFGACSKFDSSGSYQYSLVVDSAGDDVSRYVETDSSGNMYLSGQYSGTPTIKFVNSSNVSTNVATLPTSSGIAAFVSKFNSSGTYQYSIVVDSSGTDVGYSVTCDSSGNMYLASQYAGTPTIKAVNSSNVSTNVATLPVSTGTYAACVSKFNSSGTYQYSRIVDSAGDDVPWSVVCDSSGNMYVSGQYSGTPTIKAVNSSNVSTNIATLPVSTGTSAAFCSKFDSNGAYQYSRIVDSAGTNIGWISTTDSNGNMYLSGQYSGTPTIKAVNTSNVSTNITTLPGSAGIAAFLLKFDQDGVYSPTVDVMSYSIVIDSSGDDIGYSVTTDSSGNMYLAGQYTGNPTLKTQAGTSIATFPASSGTAAFCSKFTSTGSYLYSLVVDSAGTDIGYSVTCDSSGNMYLAGQYNGTPTIQFVNSSNVATLPTSSGIAAFVSKFNSSGTYQYSIVVDSSGNDIGRGVSTDSSGNMYLAGQYNRTPTIQFVNSSNVSTNVATLPASAGGAALTAFCSKFSSSGIYQYSVVVDSTDTSDTDIARAVTVDYSGNMYITGNYQITAPTIKFVNSSNVSTNVATLVGGGFNVVFCSKFSSSGTYLYSFILDADGSDFGLSLSTDSTYSVYVGGYYSGTPTIKFVNSSNVSTNVATLPASSIDAAFCSKFSSSGSYLYSIVIDSAGNERGGNGIATDSSDNMYVSGSYNGTPTIKFINSSNVSTNVATLPAGAFAACVSKFNSSGAYQYSRIVETAGTDIGYSVTCDSSGNIYLAGQYNGTPNITNEVGGVLGTLPASTVNAAFVTKFGPNGTYVTA